MDLQALLAKIRKIEIRSKHASDQILAGEYHSAFKGKGMSFSEVREYQYGDDIRHIDWNVTARSGKPHLKVYEEERELCIYFLVDVSPSISTSIGDTPRHERIAEIVASLAFAALRNNDLVGMLLFGDKVEHFTPLRKGRNHILQLIRQLLATTYTSANSSLAQALQHIQHHAKHKSIIFVISDFLIDNYEQELAIAAQKHDVIGISVIDDIDYSLPNIGFIQIQDSENGHVQWVDTLQQAIHNDYSQHIVATEKLFKRSKATFMTLTAKDDYNKKLNTLFKSRK